MMTALHTVKWIDGKREPRSPPNPSYPNGVDLVIAQPAQKSCKIPLPYPARRIGHYLIDCRVCSLKVAVSTAGRPDDPRSVTMACKELA